MTQEEQIILLNDNVRYLRKVVEELQEDIEELQLNIKELKKSFISFNNDYFYKLTLAMCAAK